MARSPRGRFTRNRGPRPRYAWLDRVNATETVLAAAAVALVDLLDPFLQEEKAGLTVVRMFLREMVRSNTSGQTVEWVRGVIPMDQDAFLAGDTPDPMVDVKNWYLNGADIFVGATL